MDSNSQWCLNVSEGVPEKGNLFLSSGSDLIVMQKLRNYSILTNVVDESVSQV